MKTGDIVKVKVLEVDVLRKRISLTMKLDAATVRKDGVKDNRFEFAGKDNRQRNGGSFTPNHAQRGPSHTSHTSQAQEGSAMASAFAKLQGLKK